MQPSRRELARALRRLIGHSIVDHGMSEALYRSHPDGNGIEIYADRPRDAWPRHPDGSLRVELLS